MLFDLVVFGAVVSFFVIGFRARLDKEIFHIIRILLLFLLAGRYSVDAALLLSQIGLLAADNYAMFLFVGFLVTSIVVWWLLGVFEKQILLKALYRHRWVNPITAGIIMALQAFLILMITVVLVMQLRFAQVVAGDYLAQSRVYVAFHAGFMSVFNVRRVTEIINGNITGSSKAMMMNLMSK